GSSALYSNTFGSDNTASGRSALYSNTFGSDNTASGWSALYSNTTGNGNIAIGPGALYSNTTGLHNIAIGPNADVLSNNLINATAIGYNAKVGTSYSLVLGGTAEEAVRVGIGTSAPNASAVLDLTASDKGMLVPRMTSAQRTAIASPATGLLVFDTDTGGFWFYNGTSWINLTSLKTLADADGDTKIQVEESPDEDVIRFDLNGTENMVLRKNTGGSPRLELPNALFNTYVGLDAGLSNTSGNSNTAYGKDALRSNTTGPRNTANGEQSLFANTEGFENTANGWTALVSNTTGYGNTAIGYQALYPNTTGFYNTALGWGAGVSAGNFNNSTAIGANSLVEANNSLVLGSIIGYNGATSYVNVGIGTTTPAYRLDVNGRCRVRHGTETAGWWFNKSNNSLGTFVGMMDDSHTGIYGNDGAAWAIRVNIQSGNTGIRRTPLTNSLEVEGDASKSSAGDWLANSDARLKKNI
ncbi:MAG: hypothetical protein AAB263_01355, partial [Planctomycetota bacterium]